MQRRREEGVPLRGEFMGEQGKEPGSTANPHRGLAIVVVLLVAVAVVIPTVVVPTVRDRANSRAPLIRGARAIALACNATRYPETCTTALTANSASLTSSPQGLAALAAAAAADALSTTLANATAYRLDPEVVLNATFTNLIIDCLHTLALAQLQSSQTSLALQNPAPEFDTLKTSLSAALTFTGTCADGLKRIPSTSLRHRANLTFQTLSNALAITNALAAHGDNLQHWTPTYFLANLRTANPPPPSRRRTLESAPPLPDWLRVHDRRILASPVDPAPDVTVALDGSGNYTSIQAAVDAAPINLPSRYVIYIKPGVYNEIVRVSSQHTHLMFLGAGINQTIITNNRSVSLTGTTTFQSATVGKYVI
jgi:pectinesterase